MRSVAALLAFVVVATFGSARAGTEDLAGIYDGKWVSRAHDGRHKGNATVKISGGRVVMASKIFNKNLRVTLASSSSGKTGIKIANADLRKANGGVVKGSGRMKSQAGKVLVDANGPAFLGTVTVEMEITPWADGIKASGIVGYELGNSSGTLFTFAFVGRKR